MLGWVLWVLVGLLATVVLALALPVRLHLSATSEPLARWRVELGLFGGLIPRFVAYDSTRPTARRRRGFQKRSGQAPKKRAGRKPRRTRIRATNLISAVPRLISGLLAAVAIERFEIEGWFGLGDPADTGRLYGTLAPVLTAFGANDHVRIYPDFGRARLEGHAEIGIAVTPLRLLPPALRFGWDVWGAR